MKRNKHHNRASPHPPKISTEIPHLSKTLARLPHLDMRKAAWQHSGKYSEMRGTVGGPWEDASVWDCQGEVSL